MILSNIVKNNVINRVVNNNLTYLEKEALKDIRRVVIDIEKRKTPGEFLEMGCALGGSAIVIAEAKNKKRPFLIYDVFEMIPPPSTRDD